MNRVPLTPAKSGVVTEAAVLSATLLYVAPGWICTERARFPALPANGYTIVTLAGS
jgi:hypothetical protein